MGAKKNHRDAVAVLSNARDGLYMSATRRPFKRNFSYLFIAVLRLRFLPQGPWLEARILIFQVDSKDLYFRPIKPTYQTLSKDLNNMVREGDKGKSQSQENGRPFVFSLFDYRDVSSLV